MSLLQLEDPIVGQTIDATLGSLDIANGNLAISAPATTTESNASIQMKTNNASGQYYTLFATNGNGGGLSDGHLQLFSYNNTSNWVVPVLDIAPQTSTIATATIAISAPLSCSFPVTAPLPVAPLIVANAGQTYSIGSSNFNQLLSFQVPSTGATIALPATASLPAGSFVSVFISPTSTGAMAIQGAYSSGESLGAGQSATYTVIQGNNGVNYTTWMRTQKSV